MTSLLCVICCIVDLSYMQYTPRNKPLVYDEYLFSPVKLCNNRIEFPGTFDYSQGRTTVTLIKITLYDRE